MAQDQNYLSPQKVTWAGSPKPGASVLKVLSPREREVLQLYAEGKITRQIAAVLHIIPKPWSFTEAQIMDRAGCSSFVDHAGSGG